MNAKRFRFRTIDLFLATFVVSLTAMSVKEGPIHGTILSQILLMILGGMLGAMTSRMLSDTFRLGTVCGLLLGLFGYLIAIFLLALGMKLAERTVVLICVCGGGVIGGLIPTLLQRYRQASLRIQTSILITGITLLVVFLAKGWLSSEQYRIGTKLKAAGVIIDYQDVNLAPTIFDSKRMIDSENLQPHSIWLRELLGVRVIYCVNLPTYQKVDHHEVFRILVIEFSAVERLNLCADYVDEEVLEILNSKQLPMLRTLIITGQRFNDESLSRLDPLSRLLNFYLDQTSITDESVEHLLAFPRLSAIGVHSTNISAEGVKRLKSKFKFVYSEH